MAYSLEAALIVPLSLVVWAGLLVLTAPAYLRVEQSSRQMVNATGYSLENQHLYRTRQLASPRGSMTALQVSPQCVLELCSLIRDDGRLMAQMLGIDSDRIVPDHADAVKAVISVPVKSGREP